MWAHVGVAQGHLLLGECGPAEEALARADAVGDSPVATSFATRERTRAWLEAGRGDLVAARARLRDVLEVVQRDGVRTFESAVLNDLVRFGRAEEAVERLRWLVGVVDGPLVQAHYGHAVAVAEGDADALQVVVDDYEALDVLAYAAEAAAELGELHQRRGDGRLATAAMQRSAELATRAGGVRTPPLARGGGVEPLTAREREVALLAAGGRSSREIADVLYLSTRTVETHLARVVPQAGHQHPQRAGGGARHRRRYVAPASRHRRLDCVVAADAPTGRGDHHRNMTPDDLAMVRRSWTELRRRRALFLERLEAALGSVGEPATAGEQRPSARRGRRRTPRLAGDAERPRRAGPGDRRRVALRRRRCRGSTSTGWPGGERRRRSVRPGRDADDAAWHRAWLLLADVLAEDSLAPFDGPPTGRDVPPPPAYVVGSRTRCVVVPDVRLGAVPHRGGS